MFRNEIQYFVVLTALVLLAPFLPSGLLILLDNLIVRLGMIAALLYCIHIGPTVGIFGLIAISALYLERNRRKVGIALEKLDAMEVPNAPQATVKQFLYVILIPLIRPNPSMYLKTMVLTKIATLSQLLQASIKKQFYLRSTPCPLVPQGRAHSTYLKRWESVILTV